ncbi:type II toxin-antitoxin system HicA family toxin [Methanoregula sp.]|uniref:type II toxin-antitoxin system HicA family toxin n=1 Tax=Methanoregula sp. TaxID=2052170 RepID=UPI00263A0817|nr:type II toxin-antitoxin system HicA family toxin [Methanoregula sp.]MDD5144496.1 type II toxin-antitoxin system HicA family toxin [Methanoregula sp.]
MKLPRNVDGDNLARLLHCYGYCIDHQTGSHQRLTTTVNGKTHDITIPRHRSLRVGTLHAILKDVAARQKKDLNVIIRELFG